MKILEVFHSSLPPAASHSPQKAANMLLGESFERLRKTESIQHQKKIIYNEEQHQYTNSQFQITLNQASTIKIRMKIAMPR